MSGEWKLRTLCLEGTDQGPELLALSLALHQKRFHGSGVCEPHSEGKKQMGFQFLKRSLCDAEELNELSPVLTATAFRDVGEIGRASCRERV